MAAGQSPRNRGRPKRGSRYAALLAKVDEVLKSGKRKSVRGACKLVADRAGLGIKRAEVLRKCYRAARKHAVHPN
jgi:hypothetical protein